MVDGHDLVLGRHHLGVEGPLNGLLYNLGPGAASQADGLLVDGLELALTDLEHEGPVGAALGLLTLLGVAGVTLHSRIGSRAARGKIKSTQSNTLADMTPLPTLCDIAFEGSETCVASFIILDSVIFSQT